MHCRELNGNSTRETKSRLDEFIYECDSKLEEHVYEIFEKDRLPDQIRSEQEDDDIVKIIKAKVENNDEIKHGRYKRVQKQLRIENGILTKSGRPVIPPSLRTFILKKAHSVAHFSCEKLYEIICQKCKADNKAPMYIPNDIVVIPSP